MPHNIQEDHKEFQEIIGGKRQKELDRYIESGQIFGLRPDGRGKIQIPIKRIELPHIVFGEPQDGVGNGPGKPGDKIGEKEKDGKKGNKPGSQHGDGMNVDVNLDEIWRMMDAHLKLPHLKPKSTQTFEEIQIKYNGISRVGPNSLRHLRRTLKETLKRQIAMGTLKYKMVPGSQKPVPVLIPDKNDFRYRQWNEIRKPSHNAAVFFVRDGSGSMDDLKCDIVSDITFWIDLWIRRFYKETRRFYIWHDTEAKEMSEYDFYHNRFGGGTLCAPALRLVEDMLRFRVPPEKWNIYIFYFGDGETGTEDNKNFIKRLKDKLGPQNINMTGITEILYNGGMWGGTSLKADIDKALASGTLDKEFVRTASIDRKEGDTNWWRHEMSPEDKFASIKQVLVKLLGATQQT